MALGKFSQQFSDEVHARINKQMRQYGIIWENKAVRLAPKRTTYLAGSISYTYDENTYTLSLTVGAAYGVFVEYGTRYMRPQPFVRPALNEIPGLFGIQTEMAFLNTPHIHAPLIASGPTFYGPKHLTAKQREHIETHLKPTSKRLYSASSGHGHVSRSKLTVRHR